MANWGRMHIATWNIYKKFDPIDRSLACIYIASLCVYFEITQDASRVRTGVRCHHQRRRAAPPARLRNFWQSCRRSPCSGRLPSDPRRQHYSRPRRRPWLWHSCLRGRRRRRAARQPLPAERRRECGAHRMIEWLSTTSESVGVHACVRAGAGPAGNLTLTRHMHMYMTIARACAHAPNEILSSNDHSKRVRVCVPVCAPAG